MATGEFDPGQTLGLTGSVDHLASTLTQLFAHQMCYFGGNSFTADTAPVVLVVHLDHASELHFGILDAVSINQSDACEGFAD